MTNSLVIQLLTNNNGYVTFYHNLPQDIFILFYCLIQTDRIKQVLALDDEIKKLSQTLHKNKSLLVMGRGYNYATCLEGALVSIIKK